MRLVCVMVACLFKPIMSPLLMQEGHFSNSFYQISESSRLQKFQTTKTEPETVNPSVNHNPDVPTELALCSFCIDLFPALEGNVACCTLSIQDLMCVKVKDCVKVVIHGNG